MTNADVINQIISIVNRREIMDNFGQSTLVDRFAHDQASQDKILNDHLSRAWEMIWAKLAYTLAQAGKLDMWDHNREGAREVAIGLLCLRPTFLENSEEGNISEQPDIFGEPIGGMCQTLLELALALNPVMTDELEQMLRNRTNNG